MSDRWDRSGRAPRDQFGRETYRRRRTIGPVREVLASGLATLLQQRLADSCRTRLRARRLLDVVEPGDRELARHIDAGLADLGVQEVIEGVGRGERVGSASVGLALTHDIDLDLLRSAIEIPTRSGAPCNRRRVIRVKKLRWSDERGRLNAADVPESGGIYVGVYNFADEA